MVPGEASVQRAAEAFAEELTRWRMERGLTKKRLATEMNFDPSYVSHVEGVRHRPTEDFARRAEAVLRTDGAVWRRYLEYEEARRGRVGNAASRDPASPEPWVPPGTGLVVDQEQAELSYRDGRYRCTVRRSLYNAGAEPITRYPMRIAVDRYPDNSQRSNQHHHEHPLHWDELGLHAWYAAGDQAAREPMRWRPKLDRDAVKEVWLLFENDHGRFPLYPGDRATIEYSYTVGEDKWGAWFQRAVRLPTRRLDIRLDLPIVLAPSVWGVETSLSAEEAPLRTPIAQRVEGDRVVYEWSTQAPSLNARYRLAWRFRAPAAGPAAEAGPAGEPGGPGEPARVSEPGRAAEAGRASERMAAAGILQRGADLLRTPARLFDLPADAPLARDVVDRLHATLSRIVELHVFGKGLGLAAPQIGLGWAAAVVRLPAPGAEPIVLLNPRVIGTSPEGDDQYEGCLSFFDFRGLVRRPLRIEVEHTDLAGARLITTYERAVARLVAHEIDHLEGRLYVDHMAAGAALVPVEEYRDTGRPWRY
ncbi:MAG TPA: peptide deformylase [Micromonosporaceae bacterium]|nr:peptide deformylase [Micromonosporaceae bacterium]